MDSAFETPSSQDDELPQQQSGLHQLKLRWQAEKACPELLQWEGELVEELTRAADAMEERAAEADSGSRSLDHQIMTIDLDRARFVLRSYLRCRLLKIDRCFLQIFSDADLFERLSKGEQEYCERAIQHTQTHLGKSALDRMPPQYQNMIKQSDTSAEPDMIPEADLDKFVFCKATRLLEDVQLDPLTGDTVTLEANELHVLHYRPVRQLALDKSLQLV